MTGTRKSNVPDVYPMAKHPKEQKGGIVEIPPFSVGPAGLEPATRCCDKWCFHWDALMLSTSINLGTPPFSSRPICCAH